MISRLVRWSFPVFIAVWGSACDGSTTAAVPAAPGVHLVGALPRDTALAALGRALVVEVRDAQGDLLPNVAVSFHAVSRPVQRPGAVSFESPREWVGPGPSTPADSDVTVKTDERGQASIRVRHRSIAGVGEVAVSVASLGYADTVRYEILPGNLAAVRALPHDSAMVVGARYALSTLALDRNGNVRDDAVILAVGQGPLSLAGTFVSGSAIGRGFMVVTAGGFTDTAWVSVVPPGTLAARTLGEDVSRTTLVRLATDGTGYGVFARITGPEAPLVPRLSWAPTGDHLVFCAESGGAYKYRNYRVNLDGTWAAMWQPPAGTADLSATYSADGQWVYYSHAPYGSSQQFDIWRARPDGTQAVRLTPEVEAWYWEDHDPSPSPDGRFVAYSSNRDVVYHHGTSADTYLRVLDLQTRSVSRLNLRALAPRWSPDGQWIAVVFEGKLSIIHPDGTGARDLSSADRYFHGVSWSPDSRWLVAARTSGLVELVSVDGQHVLPLAFARGLADPAWAPR